MSVSTVLVTGSGDGIGRATACRLAAEEFQVWAGVRQPAEAAELERLASPNLVPIELDPTDEDSIAGALERIAAEGGLDAVVSTGDLRAPGALELLTRDGLRERLELNVIAPVTLARSALPVMRSADDPRLILVGDSAEPSAAGVDELCERALEVIADALRAELRDEGVAVSLVGPAPIGADPGDAAAVIERALRSSSPSPRYPVGLVAQLAGRARGIVGDRVFDLFAVRPLRF